MMSTMMSHHSRWILDSSTGPSWTLWDPTDRSKGHFITAVEYCPDMFTSYIKSVELGVTVIVTEIFVFNVLNINVNSAFTGR